MNGLTRISSVIRYFISGLDCMKIYLVAGAILLGCLFATANAANRYADKNTEISKGVDRKMALTRSKEISNVTYDLKFTVPPQKESPVIVDATIFFDYNGASAGIPFDFEGSVASAVINGKEWTPVVENEHILVPAQLINQGENKVEFINCKSLDKALNRRADLLYTLFVPANARSAFPCFDQPDMKARFNLTLNLPDGWTALSTASVGERDSESGKNYLKFNTSDPLPTYLFSFTAGKFQRADTVIDGRPLEFFYMETDPRKTAQIPEIFRLSANAIKWMEDYTGVAYPFEKFSFVAIPDYQFGGMEHPGAIQYKARTIFLPSTPTPAEIQKRAQLLAHETAHIWFGDLVTMEWFNDVWTKEVFANLMASKATADMFPDQDDNLTFLRSIQTKALATDVTPGRHAIEQDLENLNVAGLLYGNIIYEKAPVMMRKLEHLMGSDRFRDGLSEYLKTYSYGNATWDDLIDILSRHAPEANLPEFSKVWVKEAGLPDITCHLEDGRLYVAQSDPEGSGRLWTQSFSVGVVMNDGSITTVPVNLNSVEFSAPLPDGAVAIIPNIRGEGYARFRLSDAQISAIRSAWASLTPLNRQAAIMLLYDATLQGNLDYPLFAELLMDYMETETDEQILATLCDRLSTILRRMPPSQREKTENRARTIADTTPSSAAHLSLTRTLARHGLHTDYLEVWSNQSDSLLTPDDYTNMAYHLAVRHPGKAAAILATQRERLGKEKPELLEEFDFVSRGAQPDEETARETFSLLFDPANRTTEPWALSLLSLLADESRGDYTLDYIEPALTATEDVRQTGSIFFPANWATALLSGYYSNDATQRLNKWFADNPEYRPALLRKIKESGAHLLLCNP